MLALLATLQPPPLSEKVKISFLLIASFGDRVPLFLSFFSHFSGARPFRFGELIAVPFVHFC